MKLRGNPDSPPMAPDQSTRPNGLKLSIYAIKMTLLPRTVKLTFVIPREPLAPQEQGHLAKHSPVYVKMIIFACGQIPAWGAVAIACKHRSLPACAASERERDREEGRVGPATEEGDLPAARGASRRVLPLELRRPLEEERPAQHAGGGGGGGGGGGSQYGTHCASLGPRPVVANAAAAPRPEERQALQRWRAGTCCLRPTDWTHAPTTSGGLDPCAGGLVPYSGGLDHLRRSGPLRRRSRPLEQRSSRQGHLYLPTGYTDGRRPPV
eukprot:gene15711-biopygen2179